MFVGYNCVMKTHYIKFFLSITIFFLCSIAFAQGAGNIVATVNGVKITLAQLDQWVSLATSMGAKDTPELRQRVLNDMVIREAVEQDVKKTGLLSKGSNALKVKMAEKNAEMELWFAQYFALHPLSEADIRAEYEKQAAIGKDPRNAKEYQISQIVSVSEPDAMQILSQIKNGASFETLAQEKSLDKTTSQNGGLVGWVLPTQLASPMNEVLPTLSKASVVAKPIQVGAAWYIVKVNDVKPFVMPSFDQAKANIAQSLIQKERQEAIGALLKNSKITRAK